MGTATSLLSQKQEADQMDNTLEKETTQAYGGPAVTAEKTQGLAGGGGVSSH